MKYFVTGGAGFIGSHLVDSLMKRDNEVTVYDNLSSGRREFIAHHFHQPGFKFIQADLLDFGTLRKAIRKTCFAINSSPQRKEASVFNQRYKYITALSPKDNICEYCKRPHRPYEELYNLKEDPRESNNLAKLRSKEVFKFKQKIDNFISAEEIYPEEQVEKIQQWTIEEEKNY